MPGEGKTGLVLYASDGIDVSMSFKLEFLCSNNEAEYDVLIIGIIFILQMGISRVGVQRILGSSSLLYITLISYQTAIQKLVNSFSSTHFEHVSRVHNEHVDALANSDAKVDVSNETID